MATLHVRLVKTHHSQKYETVPVSVEVLNDQFESEGTMPMKGEGSLNVEPGRHIVRARLPSGETLVGSAMVEEGRPGEVELTPSSSPREWAWWAHFLGEVDLGGAESPSRALGTEGSSQALTEFRNTWLRVWRYEDSEWRVEPLESWSGYSPARDDRVDLVLKEVNLKQHALYVLQVGGVAVPWRFMLLPQAVVEEPVQVVLRPSRSPTPLNGGLAVKAVTLDREAEALSHYLSGGSLEAARVVSEQVAGDAESLLFQKIQNPIGAAIGGYYLLRTKTYDRLHHWPRNLDEWFTWLPDGAVIHAYQLLSVSPGSETTLEQARERLIEAARRGLPIFTYGLRLLIDGLELFADDARDRGRRDDRVENSLRRLREYAGAVDWRERLTTFYGPHPAEPSLSPKTGMPDDGILRHSIVL